MSELRFTIGVPGAGSAARRADAEPRMAHLQRPEGGSAAREAEQQARLEGVSGRRSPVTLRMQGRPRAAAEAVVDAAAAMDMRSAAAPDMEVVVQRAHGLSSLATAPTAAAAVPPTRVASRSPLQTAAGRIQSLVRSLFPGDRTGQS